MPSTMSWVGVASGAPWAGERMLRSEEHTSELQSQSNLVCRLLLEKKKKVVPLIFAVRHGATNALERMHPVTYVCVMRDDHDNCRGYPSTCLQGGMGGEVLVCNLA